MQDSKELKPFKPFKPFKTKGGYLYYPIHPDALRNLTSSRKEEIK